MSSYDLTKLDPGSFEHLVNLLALRVLGTGHTGFGPGSDGGRDGYFEGSAPYPSATDRWSGHWYIQSKFHAPHLSKNPQKWLLQQIAAEISIFQDRGSRRTWPDIWIVATNIDPSGAAQTGSFDAARKLVNEARPDLAKRFHIWGGRKILDLLSLHKTVAEYYYHFLTPGQVLAAVFNHLSDTQAGIEEIIRFLTVTKFIEQQFTKLEQAGSTTDNRPGIHKLFTDLPFTCNEFLLRGKVFQSLAWVSAQNFKAEVEFPDTASWQQWSRHPRRARVWFIRGGPGQGKSTITQYYSQVQRAALILSTEGPRVTQSQKTIANEIRTAATQMAVWPTAARIPVLIELKDFAQWYGAQLSGNSTGILPYITQYIAANIGQKVQTGTLKRAFEKGKWCFIFDGLDEVPNDVKDAVASQVTYFVDDFLIGLRSDALTICTSRPQGYAGQFSTLNAATIDLAKLSSEQALECARPILYIDRSEGDGAAYLRTLEEAMESPAVQEIMTTPLQSHIMAVVVRDGGRPPERKWQLYTNFYQIIKKREANRNLPDKHLSTLLREGEKLLKALHDRLGFELHARAERSEGAQTSLDRKELSRIVRVVVSQLQDSNIDETVNTLMEATTERLVLVSTPDASDKVRFDIRPLQEFFAAEYLYSSVDTNKLGDRLNIVAGDSHWREVMHFLLSGLVENGRQTELVVAVDAIERLNDAPYEAGSRALWRRLSLGGLISARLLSEGVLEQDKRIRQRFLKCIEPTFGCVEINTLLISVNREFSKAWMIDTMIDSLVGYSEAENIGSAASIIYQLPDNHARLRDVRGFLDNVSSNYLKSLLILVSQHRVEGNVAFSEWVYIWILTRLLRDDWTELGDDGVDAAIRLLNTAQEMPSISRACGVHPELAQISDVLLGTGVHPEREETQIIRKIGPLKIMQYATPEQLNYQKWRPEVWAAFSDAKGIFRTIGLIFALCRYKSWNCLDALRKSVRGNAEFLGFLPFPLREFLPARLEVLSSTEPATDESIRELFEDHVPGFWNDFSFETNPQSPSDWSFINEIPWFVLHYLGAHTSGDPLAQGFNEYVETEPGGRHLFEIFSENPSLLMNAFRVGGQIFSIGNLIGDQLRSLARDTARRYYISSIFHSDVNPFKLQLPDDAIFLPIIVQLLTAEAPSYMMGHIRDYGDPNRRRDLQQVVAQYISAPKLLTLMKQDTPSAIRAAAGIMYLLHPDGKPSHKLRCAEEIPEYYSNEIGAWYLRAAGIALYDAVMQLDSMALRIISSLLEAARMDFPGRMGLRTILSKWRELGTAPVSRNRSEGIWD